MSKENKDLAVKDDVAGELTTPLSDAELAALFPKEENLKGIKPRLPQIGILHGQAQLFVMPDDSKVASFEAIVLQQQHCNAWWAVSFDESGGGTPPDCSSLDSVTPDFNSPDVQAERCNMCPRNKFGTDGRGKSCKNMVRLHLIMPDSFPGNDMPHRLTIPPSNIKIVDAYLQSVVRAGDAYQTVKTKFSLIQKANKEGIKYSEIVLTKGEKIPQTMWQSIAGMKKEWTDAMEGQTIQGEI